VRRLAVMVAATSLMLLSACSEATSPPVQERAGEESVQQPTEAAKDGVTKACGYGRAIEAAKQFLADHAGDQSGLPKKWVRAVVVQTILQNGVWQATAVFDDGSVRLIDAYRYWDLQIAGLIGVGDYIAFLGGDNDLIPPGEKNRKGEEETRVLKYDVLPPCG
jgi:hypothetical protein